MKVVLFSKGYGIREKAAPKALKFKLLKLEMPTVYDK